MVPILRVLGIVRQMGFIAEYVMEPGGTRWNQLETSWKHTIQDVDHDDPKPTIPRWDLGPISFVNKYVRSSHSHPIRYIRRMNRIESWLSSRVPSWSNCITCMLPKHAKTSLDWSRRVSMTELRFIVSLL